jgi:hypothetical protein
MTGDGVGGAHVGRKAVQVAAPARSAGRAPSLRR